MLDWVQYQNFKSLVNTVLRLKPFTVLVGANGAGKTSALQGLELLSKLLDFQGPADNYHVHLQQILGDESNRGRWRSRQATTHLSIIFRGLNGKIRFTERTPRPKPENWTEHLQDSERWQISSPGRQLIADLGQSAVNLDQVLKDGRSLLGSVRLLQLDSKRIAEACYLESEFPRIKSDGYGLAENLNHLAGNDRNALLQIESGLSTILGVNAQIKTPRVKTKTDVLGNIGVASYTPFGHSVALDIQGQGLIPAEHLSEGTLIILCLLAILHGPDRPRLLLIDDIQRGLHPKAEMKLVEMLKELQKQIPELQIIATTHSPFIVGACEPDEVLALALNSNGETVCKPLSEHPEWNQWKAMLSTGEFWSTFGEDWVTKDPVSMQLI